MKTASVAELKARLSEFLAAARRGEDVIVTDRGRPVARLTALPDRSAADERTAELLRSGLLNPPKRSLPDTFLATPGPPDPGAHVRGAVTEEREAGW